MYDTEKWSAGSRWWDTEYKDWCTIVYVRNICDIRWDKESRVIGSIMYRDLEKRLIKKPLFDFDNVKEDDFRDKRHGWAMGGYTCVCEECGCSYVGDKRSWMCADCAYDLPDEPEPKSCCDKYDDYLEYTKADDISDFKYCPWCGTKL